MSSSAAESGSNPSKKPFDAIRAVEFLGSVKFGIVILLLLVAVSLAGMLITQYNVPGFEQYVATLGPFRRQLYDALGLYDIYGSWYFRGLLMILSMNILMSSVEHLPNTWKLISKPNLFPSERWIATQDATADVSIHGPTDEILDRLTTACRGVGLRRITISARDDDHYVFAQSGAWNRLGAYAVHVALITIFAGGFITSQFSYSGRMQLSPGESTDRIDEIIYQGELPAIRYRRLPFVVTCTDLEQKLINPRGTLESANSMDWLTSIEIDDGSSKTRAVIGLNAPFSYHGFRFFHSTFQPIGKARSVSVAVTTPDGSETVTIRRGETATLSNGVKVRFVDFRADLDLTRSSGNENSIDYRHPAAVLEVTPQNGAAQTMIAVRDSQTGERPLTIKGYAARLTGFEKVSERHELVVRHDPGAVVVYTGSAMLIGSLLAVFLFSHRRIWFIVKPEPDGHVRVVAGGNANRNQPAFASSFSRLWTAFLRSGRSAK